jgi:hypothetical protein
MELGKKYGTAHDRASTANNDVSSENRKEAQKDRVKK